MANRARINSLRAEMPYLTHTALSALLQAAKRGDLPTVCSRPTIRAARDEVATQDTPYGPLTTTMDVTAKAGGTITLDCSPPIAALWSASSRKYYSAIVRQTYALHPCTAANPWHMVLYEDGVTPGNALRQVNSRKLDAVYWTVLEYGAAAFVKEDFWLTAMIARNAALGDIHGGPSQPIGELLSATFGGGGFNLATAGINVRLDDGTQLRLFVKFAGLLGDELALHEIWQCKGSSGTKMCILCRDIYNRRFDGDGALKNYCAAMREADCTLHTTDTHFEILTRLARYKATMGVGDFKERQTVLGFTHSEYN